MENFFLLFFFGIFLFNFYHVLGSIIGISGGMITALSAVLLSDEPMF
jgi:hypothetical protein